MNRKLLTLAALYVTATHLHAASYGQQIEQWIGENPKTAVGWAFYAGLATVPILSYLNDKTSLKVFKKKDRKDLQNALEVQGYIRSVARNYNITLTPDFIHTLSKPVLINELTQTEHPLKFKHALIQLYTALELANEQDFQAIHELVVDILDQAISQSYERQSENLAKIRNSILSYTYNDQALIKTIIKTINDALLYPWSGNLDQDLLRALEQNGLDPFNIKTIEGIVSMHDFIINQQSRKFHAASSSNS